MSVGKPLLLTALVTFSFFSGCTLLHQTHFTLLSLTVDDDQGFPRMSVQFNVSDIAMLTLTGPSHTTLFSETYYNGVHTESIYFSSYRTTIDPGSYTLKAVDASKQIIYENEMSFLGANLSVISVSADTWNDTVSNQVVALHITLKNNGDLPAYPSQASILQEDSTTEVTLLPTVVPPSSTTQITCFLPPQNLTTQTKHLTIFLSDTKGTRFAQTNQTIVYTTPIGSWQYTWYYLGTNTLKIPQVPWFADYYRSLDRFDLTDYAAYVFDPYDNAYIASLARHILSLKDVRSDVEKINFVASFVQSIEYKNDDPDNQTYEYPRYPLETLQDKQGDCEDKAILTAALLESMGYNVSLLRLPQHMAVGVHLNDTELPLYSFYINGYFFLETTTLHMTVGKIPSEYEGLTNITVYPLTPRPLLTHRWNNATRYKISTGADYVQVRMVLENLGTESTSDVEVRAAFYDAQNTIYNPQTESIPPLQAGGKRFVELSVDVPVALSEEATTLLTKLFLNGVMVSQRESTSRFP